MTNISIYYIEYKHYDPSKTTNNQVIRNLIQEAIDQIFTNQYYTCHIYSNKKLYAIGCVFSTEIRKICEIEIQEFTYGSDGFVKIGLQIFLDEFP